MIMDFKFSVGQVVLWCNNPCVIVGIYIYQDTTFEYHLKRKGFEKVGVFKVKEKDLINFK